MNVLVVEDTESLRQSLVEHLCNNGHTVESASTLKAAYGLWRVKKQDLDLVVLDLNLPDGHGSELLTQINKTNPDTGILVLTARSGLGDIVDVLDQGADDYLTKPFEFPELDARMRAIHRRRLKEPSGMTAWKTLHFDANSRTFWHQGVQLELRQKEQQLLEAFVNTPGAHCTKESLMNRLYRLDEVVSDNALEVHVARLRRKLAPFNIAITAVRGVGYRAESR